jgi:hypothetical protein
MIGMGIVQGIVLIGVIVGGLGAAFFEKYGRSLGTR